MRWQFPAVLLVICFIALLMAFGLLQQANDALRWMTAFGLVLLSFFGVVSSLIWMLVSLAAPKRSAPEEIQQQSVQVDNYLPQSEFGRSWAQKRNLPKTYDENLRETQENGIQTPHQLTLSGERKRNNTELWRGYSINEDRNRGH